MKDIKKVNSLCDLLLFELDSAEEHLQNIISDISDDEYQWEPLSKPEQASDRLVPVEQKRVWRVWEQDGVLAYDYTPEVVNPPPFTTIAWIMNHIAQTADMYLYCIESGKPEGYEKSWEDLPIPSNRKEMVKYVFEVIGKVRAYLLSIPKEEIHSKLNTLTPAPWGETRPTYKNIWGGIIEHIIHHSIQIAAHKDRIRYGL
jgi:hypothetical protein